MRENYVIVMHFNFNFMHIKNYCYARMRNRIRNGIISSFCILDDKLVVYGVQKILIWITLNQSNIARAKLQSM